MTKNNIEVQQIAETISENYLPYALHCIYDRALPEIDGLKPSHRKVLYTMYKAGLLSGEKKKSADVVGQTMGIHPHGDMAIYETIVRMTSGNGTLLMPYIESKGNFGKVYSRTIVPAAPRYTSCKLAPISRELFEGIDEDAVEMVDSYDGTKKEPVLLPSKFPNVLVNVAPGVAVGMASNVAPYNLKDVCNTTIKILKGEIDSDEDILDILGYPEFVTGGCLAEDDRAALNLIKNGSATFTVFAKTTMDKKLIRVTEVPYGVTADAIVAAIINRMTNGELKEISDVRDDTDKNGLCVSIELKRGAEPEAVLEKLYRSTPMRSKVSFSNRIIYDKRPKIMGVWEILTCWIEFRIKTLENIYKFRLDKKKREEHRLAAWEIVGDRINKVIDIMRGNSEEEAIELLIAEMGLTEIQASYLADLRLRDITTDRAQKKKVDLEALRSVIKSIEALLADEDEIKKLIISEIETIRNTYGRERITSIEEIDESEDEEDVDDSPVTVYVTNKGYIKKLDTLAPKSLPVADGDSISMVAACRNDAHMCAFTRDGMMHRVYVKDLAVAKGDPKEFIQSIIGSSSEVLYVCPLDFSKVILMITENGKGFKVALNKFEDNNRKMLKAGFEPLEGRVWAIDEDEFFVITKSRKAMYQYAGWLGNSGRAKMRIPRLAKEEIFGIQPISKVPDINSVDLEKYKKGYFVSVGKDRLWFTKAERGEHDVAFRVYQFGLV